MAIQRPHTRTNLPYCSALRLYTYWRSGLFFMLPESRNPDSPHPDPGIVHRSLSWEFPGIPGKRATMMILIIEFPAAAGNGQRFKAVAICIPRAFTHLDARQRLHTHCVHGSGSALACPVSHHCHRFAPAQRGAAGPRDTVLLLTAASSCMCAQAGHAGAAASRSTVSGQPGAHRTSTRPKHNHPAAVKSLLNKWFHANYDHPFPDGRTKAELAARTGERLLPSCGASW